MWPSPALCGNKMAEALAWAMARAADDVPAQWCFAVGLWWLTLGAPTSSPTAPTRASAGLVRTLRAGTRSSESLFRSWSLPRRCPAKPLPMPSALPCPALLT